MVQNAIVFYILTCKCAWHHSGVPFFDNFSTSTLQKVARDPHVFNILTWKCASRHSQLQKVLRSWCVLHVVNCKCTSRYICVPFLDSRTLQSGPGMVCFVHFELQMCFAPQRRAIFRQLNFKKWSGNGVFCAFCVAKALRATAACNF